MSLYIFDKDGTLVKSVGLEGIKVRDPLKPEEQMLKEGVFERIQELRAAGHVIALASNLSAVAKGLITIEEAKILMENCAEKIGGAAAIKYCGYDAHGKKEINGKPNPYARDADCHKPHPGMILEIMQELGFPPSDTYMVGNAKDDEEAARAAGVQFYSAKKFFAG